MADKPALSTMSMSDLVVDRETGEIYDQWGESQYPPLASTATTGKRNSSASEWDDEDGGTLITREYEDSETVTPNYARMGMKPALDEDDGRQLDCPNCTGKIFLVPMDGKTYRVCEFALRGPDSSCGYNKEISTPTTSKIITTSKREKR